MRGGTAGRFVGRGDELALLRAQFAAACDGVATIVVVEGEPGIGKTALLRECVRDASGATVLWGSGDSSESALEFGVARQLLGEVAAGLPSGDAFSVGAALLAEISALEERGPVVVVVDDLHWVDLASAGALLFWLRRLRRDPVLVLLATRPHGSERLGDSWARLLADADQVRWIRLSGLSPAQVRELAAMRGRHLTAESGTRLQRHTAGNPLYVSALVAESPVATLDGESEHLPAPHAYAATVLGCLSRLSAAAGGLVCAAAVVGVRGRIGVAARTAGLDGWTAAVDEAISAGLLDVVGDDLVFAHPLARAAVYNDLSPGRRRQLHLAAAAALPAPASFAHRVAAAAGTSDGRLGEELLAAAADAQNAGALGRAAQYLGWAARVDGDPRRAERSLFDAVRLLLMIGDVHGAEEHAEAVAARPDSAWRRFILAIFEVARGRLSKAGSELTSLAEYLCADEDAALVGYCAAALAMVSASLGQDDAALRWAERARTAAPDVPAVDALSLQALAWGYAKTGRMEDCLQLLAGCSTDPAQPNAFQVELLAVQGVVRNWSGDCAGAVADLRAVIGWQRRGMSIVGVTNAYTALAEAEFRTGDWDAAAIHLDLAVSLGEDLNHTWFLAYARSVAAYLYAVRGDEQFAAAHADAAQDAARAAPSMEALGCAALARAHVAWSRGDWPGVVTALQPVDDGACGTAADYPNLAMWRYRLAEAHLAQGRLPDAQRLLDLTPQAPWGGTGHADRVRLQGLLLARSGEPDHAAEVFASALPEPTSRSLADGLLALAYGRLLLVANRRKAAAVPLLTGRAILGGLGASRLAADCERALVACGVTGRPGGQAGGVRLAALTPREQVVARLVASGLTNREVAAELYLSVKAIEYHLRSVFAKLGIRSRRELPVQLAR